MVMRSLGGVLVLVWAALAHAAVTVQDPGLHVVDQAGIIEPVVEQQLEAVLLDLKAQTGPR